MLVTFFGLARRESAVIGYLYAMSVLVNLAASAALAHALSVYARGAVANASVLTSVAVLVGTLGLPEYLLVRQGRGGGLVRPRWASSCAVIVCAALTATGMRWIVPGSSLSEVILLATVVCLSSFTAFQQTRIQLRFGVGAVNILRTSHLTVLAIGQTFAAYSRSNQLDHIYAAWAVAELMTLCATGVILRRCGCQTMTDEPIDWRQSTHHAYAQLGNFVADRGLITLSAVLASVGTSAYVTVCASAMTTIALPVYAFAPKILHPVETDDASSGATVMSAKQLVVLGTAGCLLIAASTYRWLIPYLFGSEYEVLGKQFVTICIGGVFLAIWRYRHLALRRDRRAGTAVASDLCGVAVVTTLFLLSDSPSQVPVIMTTYFAVALFVIVLATSRITARRSQCWRTGVREYDGARQAGKKGVSEL